MREPSKAAGDGVRGLLRMKKPLARDLGLLEPGASEADILAAMVKHPILVERSLLQTARGAVVARPPERVFEIL